MTEPYCLAMVLCDAVHPDPATGKFSILGTFTNLAAPSFPAAIQLCVYFAVTDGIGNVDLRLQLVDANADPIDARNEDDIQGRVFMIKRPLAFPDPLVVIEGALGIGTILPNPGLYHCELWANDQILMSRRLTATLIPATPQG